jgi:hypothetical protein
MPNGTILMKLYYDLSMSVFPTNELNERKDIVKRDRIQGELGNTSKLSSIMPSLNILINKILY